MVFKAHLKWHRTAETEIVAVKTIKGIYLCLLSRLEISSVIAAGTNSHCNQSTVRDYTEPVA